MSQGEAVCMLCFYAKYIYSLIDVYLFTVVESIFSQSSEVKYYHSQYSL